MMLLTFDVDVDVDVDIDVDVNVDVDVDIDVDIDIDNPFFIQIFAVVIPMLMEVKHQKTTQR